MKNATNYARVHLGLNCLVLAFLVSSLYWEGEIRHIAWFLLTPILAPLYNSLLLPMSLPMYVANPDSGYFSVENTGRRCTTAFQWGIHTFFVTLILTANPGNMHFDWHRTIFNNFISLASEIQVPGLYFEHICLSASDVGIIVQTLLVATTVLVPIPFLFYSTRRRWANST